MIFVNFEIAKPPFAIELVALDSVWDLHNAGEFVSIALDPKTNTATMTWSVRGNAPSHYSGCRLVFERVTTLAISARDPELPYSEDLTISGISLVRLNNGDEPKYRVSEQSASNELFNLLFEFQSGRWIEIGAETVRFEGII